ncbi:MAG: shikimate dehydrogenase [Hellea sp.]|nr:shikimate dehydrogenase [Hellea sp.]
MSNVPIPKLAGVCGWPVHHSLSPLMHSFWLREMKIAGAYVHFAVRPDDAMRAFTTLKNTSISGVNVTMPLKRIAFEAADIVTPDAERLGVANCLFRKEGQLFAHNTDLEGFAAPLLGKFGAHAISNNAALVFGTGGAARAVIGALLSLNCPEIRVCGRTDEKAEKISRDIDLPSINPVSWYHRQKSIESAGLIINASSAGMKGGFDLDIDLIAARPGTFIYDLVYTPINTGLIKQARKQRLPFIGGLDMLISQARPSFKLFFGETPPLDLDPAPLLKKALSKK